MTIHERPFGRHLPLGQVDDGAGPRPASLQQAQGHRPGDVLRSRPAPPLLAAAMNQRLQRNSRPDKKDATALRRPEFVAGDAHRVYSEFRRIERQPSCCLYRIRVEGNPAFTAHG